MPKRKCREVDVDIAVLDSRVKATEKYIGELQTNHIPHIYNELSNIKIWIASASGGLAVLILILNFIL